MDFSNLVEGDESSLKNALVTGASGLLGRQISSALADAGWRVGLIGRNNIQLMDLATVIRNAGGDAVPIEADIAQVGFGAHVMSQAADALESVHLVVHAASPPLKPTTFIEPVEDLATHFAVGVSAFLELVRVSLPGMLRAQRGTFVAILSRALLPPFPRGWQSYTIAKAALAQAAAELDQAYSTGGIRAFTIFPDMLAGEDGRPGIAPESMQASNASPLNAANVAKRIVTLIDADDQIASRAISMTAEGEVYGQATLRIRTADQVENTSAISKTSSSSSIVFRFSELVKRVFGLHPDTLLEGTGIGTLPGWDSLGHIKLIMEVENEFGVIFDSSQSTELVTFEAILQALKESETTNKVAQG